MLNKRDLEDADLYFKTGRVRSPSLVHSSDSDKDVSVFQAVKINGEQSSADGTKPTSGAHVEQVP